MTEKIVKEKRLGFKVGVIIFILVIIAGLTYESIERHKANTRVALAEEVRKENIKRILQVEAEKEVAISELEAIKKRVENIKTLDDLLERDIKLYIKAHYRKVPMTVAQNIAMNIIKYSKQYEIPPILLVGIIQVESGFNPMITGIKTKYGHARGLMQVMPEWVKKMDLKNIYDLYNIDINIETGCKVFNIHLEEGKGQISEGLFRYVNQDKKYVTNVFTAMGKFVAFRSTVETGKDSETIPDNEKEDNGTIKGTTNGAKGDPKSTKE